MRVGGGVGFVLPGGTKGDPGMNGDSVEGAGGNLLAGGGGGN